MLKKYLSPSGLDYFWSQLKIKLEQITTDLGNLASTVAGHTITLSQHTTLLGNQRTIKIDCGSFSSLPKTVTNSKIKAADEVVEAVLSNPDAQTGDWTVTTSAGSLTISGNISGSTSLTLYLTVPE